MYVCCVVTVSGPKPAEHDRPVPARPSERPRDRDAGDRQRPASGRNDHGGMISQQRESRPDVTGEHSRDVRGLDITSDRGRDSHAVTDIQPVKTAAPTTTDSRAKSSSASTAAAAAGGQLTTTSHPRSSTGSSSTTTERSERLPADKASDKTPAKVSTCCVCTRDELQYFVVGGLSTGAADCLGNAHFHLVDDGMLNTVLRNLPIIHLEARYIIEKN